MAANAGRKIRNLGRKKIHINQALESKRIIWPSQGIYNRTGHKTWTLERRLQGQETVAQGGQGSRFRNKKQAQAGGKEKKKRQKKKWQPEKNHKYTPDRAQQKPKTRR